MRAEFPDTCFHNSAFTEKVKPELHGSIGAFEKRITDKWDQ